MTTNTQQQKQQLPLLTTWRTYPLAKLALKGLTQGPKTKAPPRTRIYWNTDDRLAFRAFLARHSHSPASLSETDCWTCEGCTDDALRAVAKKSLALDTTRITEPQWAGVRDRILKHFCYVMKGWVNEGKIRWDVNGQTGVETFVWDEAIRKSWMAFGEAVLPEPEKEQTQESLIMLSDDDDDVHGDRDQEPDPDPEPELARRGCNLSLQPPVIPRDQQRDALGDLLRQPPRVLRELQRDANFIFPLQPPPVLRRRQPSMDSNFSLHPLPVPGDQQRDVSRNSPRQPLPVPREQQHDVGREEEIPHGAQHQQHDVIDDLAMARSLLVDLAAEERRLRFAVLLGSGESDRLAEAVQDKHMVWAEMKRRVAAVGTGTGVFRAGGVFDMLLGLPHGAARG